MSKQELTPWFVKGEKPWEPGVYHTRTAWGFEGFSRWDGKAWRDTGTTVERAAKARLTGHQDKVWRGLAHPPKAKP